MTLSVAVVKRLRAGLLAGRTLILQRVTGPGTLFVHAAWDFAAFTLGQGEVLRADTDSLVWFDASVSYSAAWAGGVKRAFLGGGIISVDLHGARARHAADDGPRARERARKDGERLMPRPARENIFAPPGASWWSSGRRERERRPARRTRPRPRSWGLRKRRTRGIALSITEQAGRDCKAYELARDHMLEFPGAKVLQRARPRGGARVRWRRNKG